MGVDVSSTRFAAVVNGKTFAVSYRDKVSGDIDKACQEAYDWMREMLVKTRPALVAVEAPFIHRAHPSGSVGIIQVNGAVLAALKGHRSVSVQPSQWKKRVLGNGMATKDQIAEWVKSNYPRTAEICAGFPVVQQDLLDAFCLSLHGCAVLEVRDRLLVTRAS